MNDLEHESYVIIPEEFSASLIGAKYSGIRTMRKSSSIKLLEETIL